MVDWMRIYDAPDEYLPATTKDFLKAEREAMADLYDGEQLPSSPHYRTVAKAGVCACEETGAPRD